MSSLWTREIIDPKSVDDPIVHGPLAGQPRHAKGDPTVRLRVLTNWDGLCFWCETSLVSNESERALSGGRDREPPFDVDHFLPQSMGGPDTLLNYVLVCENCNRGRGNRLLIPSEKLRLWEGFAKEPVGYNEKSLLEPSAYSDQIMHLEMADGKPYQVFVVTGRICAVHGQHLLESFAEAQCRADLHQNARNNGFCGQTEAFSRFGYETATVWRALERQHPSRGADWRREQLRSLSRYSEDAEAALGLINDAALPIEELAQRPQPARMWLPSFAAHVSPSGHRTFASRARKQSADEIETLLTTELNLPDARQLAKLWANKGWTLSPLYDYADAWNVPAKDRVGMRKTLEAYGPNEAPAMDDYLLTMWYHKHARH